jgi:hypothetical protein
MLSYKFATGTCVVAHAGLRVHLTAGEAWAADDPLVATRPDLFADKPTTVRAISDRGVIDRPVEQATSAPGEKRTTRRAR